MSVIKSKLRKWLLSHKSLYQAAMMLRSKEARVQHQLCRLAEEPQKQVDYTIKNSILCGYGQSYPRTLTVNLSKPTLFNEKLLWLKYYKYNNDPIVAKCYNKFFVREYVEEHGCAGILNTLYGSWDDVKDIPWEELPDNCVIKEANGCGFHVFKRAGEPFDAETAKQIFAEADCKESQLFIASGDLFANRTPQKYICEKLLKPQDGFSSVSDYKFYCFHGVPRFLLYIWNRKNTTTFQETFKRIDWDNECRLVDASGYFQHASDADIPLPKSYKKMLDICRKLAAPFPFVRVDLYDQDGEVVFGELTFTPAGGHVLYHVYKEDNSLNLDCLTELGNLIQLEEN